MDDVADKYHEGIDHHFGGADSEAKYLNMPETPIYKKSQVIDYGTDKAKKLGDKHMGLSWGQHWGVL